MQTLIVQYDETSTRASSKIKSACYTGVDQGLGIDDVLVNIRRVYGIRADRKTVKAIMWKVYGL